MLRLTHVLETTTTYLLRTQDPYIMHEHAQAL